MVIKQDIVNALKRLGVTKETELEVHSSLRSFGTVCGGAETVIDALKEVCSDGSIFMPSLRLSPELPLSNSDKELGIVADTFRNQSDVVTGKGVFRISGWGRNADKSINGGLDYVIHNNGMALLFGVDIYKLTAMHYVESLLPPKISEIFAPNDQVNKIYPPEKWFIETGCPPVKAWYTIQKMAYDKGLIQDDMIGNCKVMYFKIWDIVGIYERELRENPYKLYGIEK